MRAYDGLKSGDKCVEKELEKALRKAVAWLKKHHYRYAVIGGIAYQYWGGPRLTIDVDIKLSVPQTDYSSTRELLRTAFPQRARPNAPNDPLVVDTVVGKTVVDFLLAIPGYDENVFANSVRRSMGKFNFWICSAEDLIIQKAVAHREKDWVDIEGVLTTQRNNLNFSYVEHWLEQFSEILEEPMILERYLNIHERVRTIISRRKK